MAAGGADRSGLPVYDWIVSTRSATALLCGSGVLALLGSLVLGSFTAALVEALPKAIRGITFATVYATAIAVFGGTAQPIVAWLIHVTGDPLALCFYLIASGCVGVAAMAMMRETAPAILQRRVLAGQAA